MNVTETKLKGVYVVEPQVFGDARGWFMESWSKRKLSAAGIDVEFVQDNQSYSAEKGTLRGLHYQLNPMCQAKLLRATRGTIFDVAVDIRKGSPQYGAWVGVELSAENKKQLFIPRGFAHGFITLTDDVEVQYRRTITTRRSATGISAGMISTSRSPGTSRRRSCRIRIRRRRRSGSGRRSR